MRIKAIVNENDSRQEKYVKFLSRTFPELFNETNPEMYFVIGGDGSMLHAHKNYNNNIPFFGKGLGTLNFIMNNFDNDFEVIEGLLDNKIIPNIVETSKILISFDNNQYKAINDIIIGSDISDWNAFEISSETGLFQKLNMNGLGMCISTGLGSTAFNLNNGGKMLPIETRLWSITSVVCNKNINEIIIPQKIEIIIKSKRCNPALYVDGVIIKQFIDGEIINISSCEDKFKLAFIDYNSFQNKRMNLQKEKR